MARAKRKKRQERARRLHQLPIVRRVADILAMGEPTKFRYQSACRHGVRVALCLQGNPWAEADSLAGRIVALALARIGATYPRWSVAQGAPPAVPREFHYCAACHGRMDEGTDQPWCSEECRNVLRLRERYITKRRDEVAAEAARMLALGATAPTMPADTGRCRHCGDLFTLNRPGRFQAFCSRKCSALAVRRAHRHCIVCAEPFAPKSDAELYCTATCQAEARRRSQRDLYAARAHVHTLTCKVCDSAFTSTRGYRAFCSDACSAENERQRNRDRMRRKRTERREAMAEAA